MHIFAVVTAVATFCLLIAGGLVTSTDSGLAVPDWPLSYGTWFPPMVGGIRYEHGHRMIAAAVGTMIVVLAMWLARREPRRWVRSLGYAAVGTVILQGLFGGLTVLLMLPPQISVAHACLGQAVFCLLVCVAQATGPSWAQRPGQTEDRRWPSWRLLGTTVAGLAGLQLLLGAILRHTGGGMGWHLGGAVLLLLGIGGMIARTAQAAKPPAALRTGSRRLGIVLLVQLVLGGLAWWQREAVAIETAHVAVGALLLAQAVLVAWHAWRLTCPPRAALRPAGLPEQMTA